MKEKNKFTVIRDTREKKEIWDFPVDEYCFGTVNKALSTGDYSIQELPDNFVTIERKKSPGEIYNNLFEKRFYNEIERLMEFKYKIIICQFDLKTLMNWPIGSGIPQIYWDGLKANANYIISKLMNIQVKYNIPISFAGLHSQELAKTYLRQVARIEGLI